MLWTIFRGGLIQIHVPSVCVFMVKNDRVGQRNCFWTTKELSGTEEENTGLVSVDAVIVGGVFLWDLLLIRNSKISTVRFLNRSLIITEYQYSEYAVTQETHQSHRDGSRDVVHSHDVSVVSTRRGRCHETIFILSNTKYRKAL